MGLIQYYMSQLHMRLWYILRIQGLPKTCAKHVRTCVTKISNIKRLEKMKIQFEEECQFPLPHHPSI